MRAVAAALAFLASTAQAFVPPTLPSTRARSALTPRMAIQVDELGAGISAPTGFFDPLGLSKQSNADVKKWREAELKHGRVAMLATVGYLVQESGFHPFFGMGNRDLGLAAFHFQEIARVFPIFWLVLLYWIAFTESRTIARGWQNPKDVANNDIASLKDDYLTGDLGYDPFNVASDPEKFYDIRTKELNNGRLAMISIIGMWAQELATGRSVISTLPFINDGSSI